MSMYVYLFVCMFVSQQYKRIVIYVYVYVCIVCICMYCMYLCHILTISICIVCICPDQHSSGRSVLKRPAPGTTTGGPHSGRPGAAVRPLYSAIGDPFPDPFWRTRARKSRWEGVKRVPGAPNRHPGPCERAVIPPQAAFEMIWRDGASPQGLKRTLQRQKTLVQPCFRRLYMCMYLYVSIYMCMYLHVLYVFACIVCITLI